MERKFIIDQKIYEDNVNKTIEILNNLKSSFNGTQNNKDTIKALDIAIQNVKSMKDIDDCVRPWIKDGLNSSNCMHNINSIVNEIRDKKNLY